MSKRKNGAGSESQLSSIENFKNFVALLKPFANDELKKQIVVFEVVPFENKEKFENESLFQMIINGDLAQPDPFHRLEIYEKTKITNVGRLSLINYLSENLNLKLMNVINTNFDKEECLEIYSIFLKNGAHPFEVKSKIVANLLSLLENVPQRSQDFLNETYKFVAENFTNDEFLKIRPMFLKIDGLHDEFKRQILSFENVDNLEICMNEFNREEFLNVLPQLLKINGSESAIKAKISEKLYKLGLPFQALAIYTENGIVQNEFVEAFERFEFEPSLLSNYFSLFKMATETEALDEDRLAKIVIEKIGLDKFLRLGLDGAVDHDKFSGLITGDYFDLSIENINEQIDYAETYLAPFNKFDIFHAKIIKFILLNSGDRIQTLDLTMMNLSKASYNIIMDAFEKRPSLNLQIDELHETQFENFSSVLARKSGNINFTLNGDWINDEKNIVSIAKAMANSSILKSISLRSGFRNDFINHVIDGLRVNESLRNIDFSEGMVRYNPKIISEILRNKKKIETIKFSMKPSGVILCLKALNKDFALKAANARECLDFNNLDADIKTEIYEAFKNTAVQKLIVKSNFKSTNIEKIAEGFRIFCNEPIKIFEGRIIFPRNQASYSWYREFLNVRTNIDDKFFSLNEFAVDLDVLQNEMRTPAALVMNRIFTDENLQKRLSSLLKEDSVLGGLFRCEYCAIRNEVMDNNFGAGLKKRLIRFEFNEQLKIEQMPGVEFCQKSGNFIFPRSNRLDRIASKALTESRIVEFLTLNPQGILTSEQEKNANALMLVAMKDANSRVIEEYIASPELYEKVLQEQGGEVTDLNLSFIKFLKCDLGKLFDKHDALKASGRKGESAGRSI